MKIKNYPDGGKYVINDLNEISLTYRINSYEDLFLLKSIKDSNANLKEITIPCMFQQQHDKRFNQNESFELKLVCDFINSIGFVKVRVFHPHSDVTPALLNNCEVIDNYVFINNILGLIEENYFSKPRGIENNLILMSTDSGGFKPLMKLCKQLDWKGETYSASKSRSYENGESKLIQVIDRQDFKGKDILIVDDILVGGNTFLGLAKLLESRNIGKLYLAVSHITVQNLGEDPVTNYFDKVFCTNSKFDNYIEDNKIDIYSQPKNLEIIKLF
jgi:ribose-phosphate pyrophosphokinase